MSMATQNLNPVDVVTCFGGWLLCLFDG